MDRRRDGHGGDHAPEAGVPPTDGDGRGADGCTTWGLAWTDLAPADYEAMWRQAAEFAAVARELRAIVRGGHPYADGDD